MLPRNLASANACSGAAPPVPVEPPVPPAIDLPSDQYLHRGPRFPKGGAPTEWWWHIGTLRAGDRIFGFEINAASLQTLVGDEVVPYGLTQVMVTDVDNRRHLQATGVYPPKKYGGPFDPDTWAQTDPAKPWSVRMGNAAGSHVTMNAPDPAHPTQDMAVKAAFLDEATKTPVSFDLVFSQRQTPTFLVWGTGVNEILPPPLPPLQRNNYYYSLTRLEAKGTITINGERIEVAGVTWMDHEYGYFGGGHKVKWILQDMQLDGGISISNYTVKQKPRLNQRTPSCATVQRPDGTTFFVQTYVTPSEPWTSEVTKQTYFTKILVEFPSFNGNVIVQSLFAAQEFSGPRDPQGKYPAAVYEGVARASGAFESRPVSGTAWIEQTSSEEAADSSSGHLGAFLAAR